MADVPDTPGNLNSLMSARRCAACPHFGEQFDTDSLSSEWSHVFNKAAKSEIYIFLNSCSTRKGAHLCMPNHDRNFCYCPPLEDESG